MTPTVTPEADVPRGLYEVLQDLSLALNAFMLDSGFGATGDLPRHTPEKPRLQAGEQCGCLIRGLRGQVNCHHGGDCRPTAQTGKAWVFQT